MDEGLKVVMAFARELKAMRGQVTLPEMVLKLEEFRVASLDEDRARMVAVIQAKSADPDFRAQLEAWDTEGGWQNVEQVLMGSVVPELIAGAPKR
jgi:hypothetical protein